MKKIACTHKYSAKCWPSWPGCFARGFRFQCTPRPVWSDHLQHLQADASLVCGYGAGSPSTPSANSGDGNDLHAAAAGQSCEHPPQGNDHSGDEHEADDHEEWHSSLAALSRWLDPSHTGPDPDLPQETLRNGGGEIQGSGGGGAGRKVDRGDSSPGGGSSSDDDGASPRSMGSTTDTEEVPSECAHSTRGERGK